MPTAAAQADASVKISSVATDFPNTDVFWEFNGFDEEQRRRIKADMRIEQARQQILMLEGEQDGDVSA